MFAAILAASFPCRTVSIAPKDADTRRRHIYTGLFLGQNSGCIRKIGFTVFFSEKLSLHHIP
ncbi:hypothetical protein, partial [Rothia dentocariosa]|uniref:hypothetical protein n=1 Tax=Rothia dentocariosa TaxID=2047 RepID=UPI001EE44D8D